MRVTNGKAPGCLGSDLDSPGHGHCPEISSARARPLTAEAAEAITRPWGDEGLELIIRPGEGSDVAFEGLSVETGQLRPLFPGLSLAQSSPAARKKSSTCRMTMSLPCSEVCSQSLSARVTPSPAPRTAASPVVDCSPQLRPTWLSKAPPQAKVAFQHLSTSAPAPSQIFQEPENLKFNKAGVPRGILLPMEVGGSRERPQLSFRRKMLGHSREVC